MRVSPSAEIRVLHVDDDVDFADVTARHLERVADDVTVETVTSAADALDRLGVEDVDCVVSDYDLAGQNGIEFLRAVREEYPDLPFILFTGKGSEDVASEAISAGVSDYLRKDTGVERYELLANRIETHVNRTRTQRNLEEREAHLKHAQAMGNLGSWFANVDDDELVLSEEGRNILGIDPDVTVDYETYLANIHPDDRAAVAAAWESALAGAGEYDIEHRVVPREGEVRWVRERANVEFDDDGSPRSGIGLVQDITEDKERERRLREERDRREALFQNPRDAIVEVGHDEEDAPVVRSTNETFTDLFGYDPDAVVGERIGDLLIPDDDQARARHEKFAEQVLAGESVEAEVQRLTKDGPRDFHIRVFPFTVGDGERGAYSVFTDITERKERELELERYERMANAAGDMVYILDDEGRMSFVNDAAEQLTGYDSEELLGEHIRLLMGPDTDVADGRALIRRILSADEPASSGSLEWTLERADGETVPCESHITFLEADGEFAGSVGVVRDITERKEREEQLESFTRIVSHDLRNPLTVASGRLELARMDVDSDHLEAVASALDRMETLVDDLLALSQVGSTEEDLEPVALGNLAEDAWRHVATAEATLVTDTDRSVQADRTRLQQLFENLVRNAVEHGSTSPRSSSTHEDAVGREASDEPSVADAPEDAVEHGGNDVTVRVGTLPEDRGFYVEDDGPGIPTDERADVFDSGYTSTEGGTGFGLAIVAEIATGVHDWDVEVTDGPDGGARFRFTGVEFVD